MSGSTELYLPPTLPYPIKVTTLEVNPSANVERGTRLLSYSFVHLSTQPNSQPETRFGTWDSTIEGTVETWKIKKGDVISAPKAKQRPVVVITEPCKHGVQIGGLCGICGKDMTEFDYTGFSDASRASIQMTHSAFGPTVSLEEAQRIERETAEHLLKSRKLSLIVDLDQTIVHATVDPTVGEWIGEGEAWEARQAQKASTSKNGSGSKDDDSSDSDDTMSESDDECNPNWEALKDVKKFRLGPETFGHPARRLEKGKQKLTDADGTMYYIKPRPGWQTFLRDMSAKYEMHVYTMGTRAYAEEVCAAIDPDGKIFGGRLLSRDESGSLTQKSLQRLFPCDTSMVVIIDDRADVWEWSPNLIKVIPYDFFVGIGDINSTFLPKVEPLTASVPTPSVPPQPPTQSTSPTSPSDSSAASSPPNASSSSTPATTPEPEPEAAERAKAVTNAMIAQNNIALAAQVEDRPLAKKQEALQDEADAESASVSSKEDERDKSVDAPNVPAPAPGSETPKSEKPVRKALLKNDDVELGRVSSLLNEIHNRFFAAYDSRSPNDDARKRKLGKAREVPYDVTSIIPRIRSDTLVGVHILFSSVIPLDTPPETTEIWRMAHMFGATCSTELSPRITHVVAAKRGTVKVDAARRRGGIHIVWLAWLTDSLALWRRQPEGPYLLDEPHAAAPAAPPDQQDQELAEQWDVGGVSEGELADIDWDEINDEVDAAMNESDSEDGDGEGDGANASVRSEDDGEDWSETGSNASGLSTPRKRKRLRSLTPSEAGANGTATPGSRSPLAKRKKLSADRAGASRLKEATSAEDIGSALHPVKEIDGMQIADEDEDEDEEDEDEDIDDDFLARELEEELG